MNAETLTLTEARRPAWLPIVKDGYRFVLPLWAVCLVLALAGQPALALLAGGAAAFVTYFFRDPERAVPVDPAMVLSPADGVVARIDHGWKDELFGGEPGTRVSIFLSVLNVHVNRWPVAGRLEKKREIPGKFMAAFNHYASEENNRVEMLIAMADGKKVVIKQIVGILARRIVCWPEAGESLEQGQRFGLMRFGSRMDVIFPAGAEVLVDIKQVVRGGLTPIAKLGN